MVKKVIELTDDMVVKKPRSFMAKIALFGTKSLLILAGVVILSFGVVRASDTAYTYCQGLYDKAASYLVDNYIPVKVIKEYIPHKEASLDELITIVAKEQKVPTIALRAIVYKESNGIYLYRFEPRVFDLTKRDASESEARMLASSHGFGHVMGFNAEPRCKMKWHELYEPYKGLTCAAMILSQNMAKYDKIKSPGERLRLAFRDYNGSGEDADRYAESAMAVMARMMMEEALG